MSGASDIVLLARVTGSLVVVVALALLAARFARRTPQGRHTGDLRVCERVGLTRESAAMVLESDGRRLLIGVTPAQVTLLADLGPVANLADDDDCAITHELAAPDQPVEVRARSRRAALDSGAALETVTPVAKPLQNAIPAPRRAPELSRRTVRELQKGRRQAVPPTQRGTGSVLDPRTWQQGVEALRDLTARRQ